MLNSLSCMLFGNAEQGGADNTERNDSSAAQQSQDSQEVKLSTAEEDMGWLLVNVSRGSSPSLPDVPEQDTSLRRPDGTVFDGVLDLSSASSSDSEDAETDSNNVERVSVGQPSPRSFSPECFWEDEDETDCSSTCSSLSVIFELNEEEPELKVRRSLKLPKRRFICDKMGDSWAIMPPPCFTGTEINNQMKSSPLENTLIEYASLYAGLECPRYNCHGLPHDTLCVCNWTVEMGFKDLHQALTGGVRSGERQRLDGQLEGRQEERRVVQPVTAPTECYGVVFLKKQIHFEQRKQKAAARKFYSRNSIERNNKVQMAQSYSGKQMSARNRHLKPSGSKCSRFTQRTH